MEHQRNSSSHSAGTPPDKSDVSSLASKSKGMGMENGTRSSSSGLSELSKQLRLLQATNRSQSSQIDRLERQLRLLTETKGVSISDLRSALDTACKREANAELQSQIVALQAELERVTLVNSQNSNKRVSTFEKESSDRLIATLQLKVGELEEVETSLRDEIKKLYQSLNEQTSKATRLESECEHRQEELENLRKISMQAATDVDAGKQVVEEEKKEHVVPEQQLVEAEPIHSTAQYQTIVAAEEMLEICRLSNLLRASELNVQLERDRAQMLQSQLEARETETQLRNDQFKSRFQVQDERIFDLEQQLSSMYAAFGMLQQEHSKDDDRMEELEKSLQEADSFVAHRVSVEEMNNAQSSPPLEKSFSSPLVTPVPTSYASSVSSSPPSSVVSPYASTSYSPGDSITMGDPVARRKPSSTSMLLCEGFLMKRDKRGNWKKRYFMLYGRPNEFLLSYSMGPEKPIKGSVGSIKLGVSSVVPLDSYFPRHPHAFALQIDPTDDGAEVLEAAAKDRMEMNKWLAALTVATGGECQASTAHFVAQEAQEDADHEMALRLSMGFMP